MIREISVTPQFLFDLENKIKEVKFNYGDADEIKEIQDFFNEVRRHTFGNKHSKPTEWEFTIKCDKENK